MAFAHLLHLMAELAHALIVVGVHLAQTGDQRNRERQGLAGACTATAKDVASSQGIGKRVGLDRESGFLAVGREHADQRTGNTKFGERQWTFLLAGLIEIGGEGIFIFNNSGIGHNGLSCQTLRTLRKPINNSPHPILSWYGRVEEFADPNRRMPSFMRYVDAADTAKRPSAACRRALRGPFGLSGRVLRHSMSGSSLAMVPVALPMALRPW